jgi:hypothetical protein
MIRRFIGAVDCSNRSISVVAELGFPKSHDKAMAQMSFVSQLTLAIGSGMIADLARWSQKRHPEVASPLGTHC